MTMKREDVQVGQIWKRQNGRLVQTAEERVFCGTREFLLDPVEKGRKSWKWDGGILNDLDYVGPA